jgi:pimeloyl-ACP methyl ester carboxylesterase
VSITTVDDHLIHYEALGRGEPLIFIHGWIGSWRYWWPSMQSLSTHYRSFAFDLWGFGDSSKVQEKYKFDEYVEMLGKLIDRLGMAQPVTIVGHSLGAAVGLRYATQNPGVVKRLAAVALPIQGDYLNTRLVDSNADTLISRVLGKANSYPEVESELRKIDAQAVNRVAEELLGENFAIDLDRAPCPVLLVFGEQDPVIEQPTGDYYHFQKSGNNRAYVAFESCNHFPMLEETAKFNRLILEFMRANNNLADLSPKEYWQRRTN